MNEPTGKIVIVGGGAGGLELATRLGRKLGPERVTLVDRNLIHVWKPALHEVASGTLNVHREGLLYFMLARDRGFTFMLGEMDCIDRESKVIGLKPIHDANGEPVLPERQIGYDTLVLAVGSRANFFDTPGAAEHARVIDTTGQAEEFRLSLLTALTRTDEAKRQGSGSLLHITIVGGGATGVELAAELELSIRGLIYYGLHHLDPATDVRITILEGAPRILPPLPDDVSETAARKLRERGIRIRTDTFIASVGADTLHDTEGGRYASDLCVWAAGIKAPAFLATLGLETNRINQLVVDGTLRTADPSIYAFGDCAQAAWRDGRFLPPRAQVAHQQVGYLFPLLAGGEAGEDRASRGFRFRDYGSLVSLGRGGVVGNVMGTVSGKDLFVEGLFARLMYKGLRLSHYAALLGLVRTGFMVVGRAILKRGGPRFKVH